LTMELMERAPEKLIRASMAPVRRAGIGPMLVGRGLEEINWEPVKLNDLHVVHKRTDRSEFDTKG
ncbi:MAG: hypothetical protein Q4C73_11760, partial [Eubacteriales bacterium]|nr:hypothetical protein [Eubacteriales bacterium]